MHHSRNVLKFTNLCWAACAPPPMGWTSSAWSHRLGSDPPALAGSAEQRPAQSVPYLRLLQGGPQDPLDRGALQDPGDRLGQPGPVALSRPKEKRRSQVSSFVGMSCPQLTPQRRVHRQESPVLGGDRVHRPNGHQLETLRPTWHHPPPSIAAIHPCPSEAGPL